jgi:hypothetical protein
MLSYNCSRRFVLKRVEAAGCLIHRLVYLGNQTSILTKAPRNSSVLLIQSEMGLGRAHLGTRGHSN